MPEITRREFLRTSSLTILAAAVAACSKEGTPGPGPGGGTLDDIIAGRGQTLTYISVGTELLSSVDERLAFGIVDPAQGLVRDATGRIWFAPQRDQEALGPFEVSFHGEGLPDNRGFYATQVEFPSDGQWLVLAEIDRGNGVEIAAGNVQVGRRNGMPIPGEASPTVQTPTLKDARGVDPICTRIDDAGKASPCGMHTHSLADVLDRGEKAIVMIATPAYCESALCGPEVDILDELRADATDIRFIHIELLKNDDPDTVRLTNPLSPAALAFGTTEEPAFYAIGTDGVITERLLGPGDVATFRDAIGRLQNT